MTRRLGGGTGSRGLAAITSLFVGAALACGMAAVGCSSNSSSAPSDSGPDVVSVSEGGADGEAGPVEGQCKPPTFTPPGGTVAAGSTVTLASAGLPANGFVYYTTDGTIPTHGSKAILSGGTITITASETVYAIAYASGSGGCADSTPAMATFTLATPEGGMPEAAPMLQPCVAPTFNPPAGTVTVGSDIAIVPPTDFPTTFPQGNAAVYFTTDGTLPTHASQVYSGPIQIVQNTAIHAIASYPGVCTDSTPALANYVVAQPEAGTLTAPAFNPPAQTANNDFAVSLTETSYPSATICFTLGAGTTAPTPTCTVTANAATCTGSSQTFNAGAGLGAIGAVTINGSVSDPATGSVTVSAIACAPNNATTTPTSQTYKLQVANPTMQGPAPSEAALPWITPASAGAAPYNPTMASPTNGATLRYAGYTTGTPPSLSCTTGTLLVNSAILMQPANPGALPVQQNITYEGVACKPGYAPSAVESFGYQVVLSAPAFYNDYAANTAVPTSLVAEGTGTYDRTLAVDVLGCGGAALCTGPNTNTAYTTGAWWGCYTTNGSAPGCGATASTCATGSTLAGTVANAVPVTTTGTVVNAIACATNLNPSPAATATYTLQLDPPGLDGPVGVTTEGPGCTNTTNATYTAAGPSGPMTSPCTVTGATTPILSYSIPASAIGTYIPTIEETVGTPPPAAVLTGPVYQFACVMKGGTPACTSTGCATGAIIAGTGTQFQTTETVALGTVVAPGDSWSIIGCPGTAAASVGFLPSAVETFTFSPPGAAVGPAVSPVAGTYNNVIAPTFTNVGTVAETVCYTLDGTTPTCTAGVCSAATIASGGTVALGIGTAPVNTTTTSWLTSGGSGYTTAPTVTIAAPTGTGAQQASATATLGFSVASITLPATAISGCGATPTVTLGAPGGSGTTATATATVDSTGTIIGYVVTNGGSGYTAAPTVTISAGCAGTPITGATAGTAVLATAGSVISLAVTSAGAGYTTVPAVSFSGGGGSGAAATATLGTWVGTPPFAALAPIQDNDTTLTVLACTNGAASSTAVPYVYNFTLPTPTVADLTQGSPAGTVTSTAATATSAVAVTAGSTLPIGDVLQFGVTLSTNASTPNVCYTTDGTAAACGATTLTCSGTGTSLTLSYQATGLFAGQWTSPAVTTTPTTFTANTLNAIVCDVAGGEVASAAYSATLNLTAQTPLVVLDNAGAPKVTGGVYVGVPTGTYYSALKLDLVSTSGATICYSTVNGATPACSAGTCTGGSSTFVAGTPILVDTTGSILKAVACSTTLTSAVSAGNTYTLDVAPIILTNVLSAPTAPSNPPDPETGCPASPTAASVEIGFDCANLATTATAGEDACSTATTAAYGPSTTVPGTGLDPTICYSTNGTAVNACAPTTTGITCFSTVTGTIGPLTITNAGTGCPANPVVTFTGGAGTGAAATATASGGVLTAVTITNGGSGYTSAPAIGFTGCTGATATAVVGSPTKTIALSANTTIHALGCLTGTGVSFNSSAATLPVVFTPWTDATTPDTAITFTGAPATDFAANETVDATGAGGTGYFAYSGESGTLYFGVDGAGSTAYTAPSATTYVAVYIGNGATTGAATTGPASLGSPAGIAGMGAQYVVEWPTNSTTAPAVFFWNNSVPAWQPTSPALVPTYSVPSTLSNLLEFSIPVSSLPQLGSLASNPVTVLGSVVTAVPALPVTGFTFPLGPAGHTGAYGDWFVANLNSCLAPASQLFY